MSLCGGFIFQVETDGPDRIREFDCRARLISTYEVRRLSRASLPSDTVELAEYLIGKTIVRKAGRNSLSGRIVETEAYPPGDRSGHAYHGRTDRKRSLFLGKGFAYVYFIYGTSYMLNVTAEEPGVGAGVLLRAIEPLEGIDLMKRLRNTDKVRRFGERAGTACGGIANRPEVGRSRPVCQRSALAWDCGPRECAHSKNCAHRHHP